jgi:hypothetical protein
VEDDERAGRPSTSKTEENVEKNQRICWPESQTVNQKYYFETLTKLQEWVRKKRLELWKKKSWIFHQDRVPAHSAFAVKQFLADKCIPVLDPPPSPIHQI